MSTFTVAPLPDNEPQRLQTLRSYEILDTPPEAAYDDFTVLASRLLQVPIALISLIDEDRQWFKSKVGLDAPSTHRDFAFCAHAILDDQIFVVEDASGDERFAGNPLVTQDPAIRFYAGCPLITPDGHALGTLCVIDRTPRRLSSTDADTLRRLSNQLVNLLELRKTDAVQRQTQQRLLAQAAELRRFALVTERTHNVVIVSDPKGLITWVNASFERVTGYSLQEAIGRKPGDLLQFEGTSVEARASLRQAVQERRHAQVQILNRGKSGNVYWMDVDLQPLFDRGEFAGFVAIETDITDLVNRQAQLSALLENLPVGLIQLDENNQVRQLNTEAKRILQCADDAPSAKNVLPVQELMQKMTGQRGPGSRQLVSVRTQADSSRWLDVSVASLPHSVGEMVGSIIAFSDQTEQIRNGRYLELASQTADVGYWTWNLAEDTLDLSDAWRRRMGLGDGPIATRDLVHPEDQLQCRQAIIEVLKGSRSSFKFEERLRWHDGHWSWVLCGGTVTERDAQGRATHLAGIHLDINEEKQTKEALHNAATTDPLTQLPNRRVMLDRLNRALSSARRHGQFGAVLYLDLDHFKRINDTYGHGAGDLLLKKVADLLLTQLRQEDTLARMGGDEMMILLPRLATEQDLAKLQAHAVARKLLGALNNPIEIEDTTVTVGTSIGITLFPKSAEETVEDLVREADTAMYGAKGRERGSLRFFDGRMHQEIAQRFELERDLRSAVKDNRLAVFLQGKWNRDHELSGAELLLRWQDPVRGWVSPVEFIPLAEESELIQDIGHQVLQQAVQIALRVRRLRPDFVLSVNISPKQFGRQDFVEELRTLTQQAGLPPDALMLEITEGVLLQEELAAIVLTLSEQGFRLSLDDFGTGYSSLAYLKRLPVHELKIDRAFVRDIESDRSDAALVQAILTIADRFDIQTVAEGVETPAQVAFLTAQGCDLLQGFFFDKPQPWEAFLSAFVDR